MRITQIEPQKRNKHRVNIYVDNQFAFGLHEETLFKMRLQVGMEIDTEDTKRIVAVEEQERGNNYGLNLISFHSRTEKEIYTKMMGKGYDEEVIKGTIEFLKRNGFLDDEKFAESYVNDKSACSKYGSTRIKFELSRKGIDKATIDRVVEENLDYNTEYETAKEVALKKIASCSSATKDKTCRKLAGFLQRKGYSYDIVSSVLKELLG